MIKVKVTDIHISKHKKDTRYGYCVCGREVINSPTKTDKECPLCGAILDWD